MTGQSQEFTTRFYEFELPGAPEIGANVFFEKGVAGFGSNSPLNDGRGELASESVPPAPLPPYMPRLGCGSSVNSPALIWRVRIVFGAEFEVETWGGEGPAAENHFRGRVKLRYDDPTELDEG